MQSVLVTVGTTLFDGLIEQMDRKEIQEQIIRLGFDHLIIQYGKGSARVEQRYPNLTVEAFDFKPTLAQEFSTASFVISHAGSGSVMEALRNNKPLIVVVNDALMDNHQLELAEALQERGNLIATNCSELLTVLKSANLSQFKPYVRGEPKKLAAEVDKMMGFS